MDGRRGREQSLKMRHYIRGKLQRLPVAISAVISSN
jgi:hypothetical protein